jgi:hypothetical protein
MNPSECLNVRFHFGGEFVRIGPELHYVGGDDAMSEIERASLSMLELKVHLSEHMNVKESMKYHFLLPGKELVNGLFFLTKLVARKCQITQLMGVWQKCLWSTMLSRMKMAMRQVGVISKMKLIIKG